MTTVLNPILDRWRFFALVISATMLAIAHAFQTFGHLAPCKLCLKQRTVYWVAGGVAAISMVAVRLPGGPKLREASCYLLGVIFLVGAGTAAYHAGAEWKFWPGPQSCSGGGRVNMADLQALLAGKMDKIVRCDEAAWRMFGVSMAGWNAIASLLLVLLSAASGLREREKAKSWRGGA
jgi:disulfide bond formation protein DsbB